jgi:hypothetical protein
MGNDEGGEAADPVMPAEQRASLPVRSSQCVKARRLDQNMLLPRPKNCWTCSVCEAGGVGISELLMGLMKKSQQEKETRTQG